jgi:hypothetical protein
MTIQLSAEQLAALRQGSDRVEALDEGGHAYVIIARDVYLHLQGLAAEAEEQTRQRLRGLIQEGIDSGDYQPADQVFAELREYAAGLDSRSNA